MTVWKILQREQVLFADQRYSEDLFLDAYRWMAKQIQATFWKLHFDQIKDVQVFTAR